MDWNVEQDGTAARTRAKRRRRSQVVLRGLLLITALALAGSPWVVEWLGNTREVVGAYEDSAFVLGAIAVVASWLVDPIYDRLTRVNLLPPMKVPGEG